MRYRLLRVKSILFVAVVSACGADDPVASPEEPARVPRMLEDNGASYTVDTRAGLTFQINKTSCDLVSLHYRGVELQDRYRVSGIGSGLGTAAVTATASPDSSNATITCATPTLTHYYVARVGTSAVFMATHITAEPTIGELRYIARLDRARLPTGNPNADIAAASSTVEGSDVFALASGETRSKYYNNARAIDNLVHGVTGAGVGVYMITGNRESSSGGPFFRDINNQGSAQQELYNYMNSGHTQTDAQYRMGLHGPYALVVTSGEAPNPNLDMSWMGALGLTGWVKERGQVTGTVSGAPSEVPIVVGWANERAQYWARANAGGGFASPAMIPGTYAMTLYRKELALSTTNVTVGTTSVTQNLLYANPERPFVFRIGERDGTPEGFRNAVLQPNMHPSDARMQPWGPLVYTVGSARDSDFPMAQFKAVNDPTTIRFTLRPDEVRPRTLRVAITLAFAGGRPIVSVNPGTPHAWTGPVPAISPQPNSRGVTRGTYRGNNTEFTFEIPASALVAGANTLTIGVASGSSGNGFLSPNFVYDAVQLDR
ncbi:MAG: hypothetical protein KY464_07775 [Gemmatimonadetes bacterium]|nr:hypothetical protein [Gemmatimonadota bacterium]